ncbi:oxalurate catabolism protein HpxZ [Lampropedia puyangensis]|uniref:Oxalurate catabolism protein HpxZ n=1 Tax=Lampropedia puyangensis TaxID=1330072 RepID=A0A4S8F4S6_9BURK|nr:oxalurate catabolism protein HpxZ [Lampropedia puyangensis]THU00232.1 oxalurate catabolism protein HpxZ [Lampropedia puyangensis]
MYEVNIPAVVAEVQAQCERYERALTHNLVDELDALFWPNPNTIRYGAAENLYGYAAIAAFRAQRPSQGLMRTVTKHVVTTYGYDMATSHLEFVKDGQTRVGRQTQTWLRLAQGWQVVSAHVSWMD